MSEYQDLEQEQFSELNEIEAEDKKAEQAEIQSQEQSNEDDLEPRYRGKSAKEIAMMHQEAERLIARQAQEVGEVRKLADELIKSQLKPKTEEAKKVDFFENPDEAIRQAIESNPEVANAKQFAMQARQQMARDQLLKKHPDAFELVQNDDFRSWIASSPVRQRLAVEADRNFDVDAADELYSTYKALRKTQVENIAQKDKEVRDKTLKSVSVETSGTGESSKKVYRRADIIQLQLRDPRKFESMRDVIDAAYREGRIR